MSLSHILSLKPSHPTSSLARLQFPCINLQTILFQGIYFYVCDENQLHRYCY